MDSSGARRSGPSGRTSWRRNNLRCWVSRRAAAARSTIMSPTERQSIQTRIDEISTRWTMLFQAHTPGDAAQAARQALVQRYRGAVYRYRLGAVRDEGVAKELAQEFAVRFLHGDFRRADPERGRFRDYLKTALIHLVNDHKKDRRQQPGPLPPDHPA